MVLIVGESDPLLDPQDPLGFPALSNTVVNPMAVPGHAARGEGEFEREEGEIDQDIICQVQEDGHALGKEEGCKNDAEVHNNEEISTKASWSSRSFGDPMEKQEELSLFFVTHVGEEEGKPKRGKCNSEDLWEDISFLKLALIGFFLGGKPGFTYEKVSLEKQRKIRGRLKTFLLSNGSFLFQFSEAEDMSRVLEKGVWLVGEKPIFLKPLSRKCVLNTNGVKEGLFVPTEQLVTGIEGHLPMYALNLLQMKTFQSSSPWKMTMGISFSNQFDMIGVRIDAPLAGSLAIRPLTAH
ncbi:hypothetical protein NE237_012085 [Protea cynaroides]|uniref:DUF4283 domain-containing protein n=1 Tax=Protea cynaroides TaxID=273540 RepID=A0A9Q0H0D8_9MAGN|nr:hypothetical protein NE237_012085 [Protea cynaroides]